MSKIAVVAIIGDLKSGATRGVFEKVSAQVNALREIGQDVKGFLGYSGDIQPPATSNIEYVLYNNQINRAFRKARFFDDILKELLAYQPTILYLRYPLSDLALNTFLRRLRQQMPDLKIAIERQTKELPELLAQKSLGNLAKFSMEFLFRNAVQRKIDFNVGVTQEICNYITSYYPKAKCITSGNGIPSRMLSSADTQIDRDPSEIRLIFVGNITAWSGLEILAHQLADMDFQHEGRRIVFDIVGEGVALAALKEALPADTGNVVFHGFLQGQDLVERLEKADLAIGALNNKKRLLMEGSNLKLRLYCAVGVPFLLGEFDTDFSTNEAAKEFFLEMKSDGSLNNDDVKRILDFALSSSNDPHLKKRMIEFARSTLIWEEKMRYILNKISESKA